jgi:hypothetical protein
MPQIVDPLPQDLVASFAHLCSELDAVVPPRQLDRNILVATWNVRAFGGVTQRWRSEEGDSSRRDLFDLRCVAEVVSRFDVVAIEEARENLSALRLDGDALRLVRRPVGEPGGDLAQLVRTRAPVRPHALRRQLHDGTRGAHARRRTRGRTRRRP